MAVWIDPVIEYIVREARHDMGSKYDILEVTSHLTEQTPLPCLLWNEGSVDLEHTMQIQGAQVETTFEVQVVGFDRADVGRTLFDFENALIGTADPTDRDVPIPGVVAHHNVAGWMITQSVMTQNDFGNMGDRYRMASLNKPGVRSREDTDPPEWPAYLWFPTHQVERATVEGQSTSYDGQVQAWRGRMTVKARVSNTGGYE